MELERMQSYYCAIEATMAIIGGFIGCNDEDIITYLRFNMRSQIYAKSLPMPIVWGVKRRLMTGDLGEVEP